MKIYEKNIKDITINDINDLIKFNIIENKNLEYKSFADFSDSKHKNTLIKEICGFANAEGGLLIYGISENKGYPAEITGIEIDNIDELINTIESIILSNITPTIHNLHIIDLSVYDKKLILIKVPKLFNKPYCHIVNDKSMNFYIRRNNKTEALHYDEVADFFNISKIEDEIIKNHDKKIYEIYNNITPTEIRKGYKFIIQLMPLSSKDIDLNIFLDEIRKVSPTHKTNTFNDKGLISYLSDIMYIQNYKNGNVECVISAAEGNKEIDLEKLIGYTIEFIQQFFEIYNLLGLLPPIKVFITLTNVENCYLNYQFFGENKEYPLDKNQDIIKTKNVTFSEFYTHKNEIAGILKDIINTLFNHFQRNSSPLFDANGNYKGTDEKLF